jgi:glycosyltransferase involved in cell wall biosynthesis
MDSLLVYNGVDTDFLPPDYKGSLRKHLSLGDDKVSVVVGRLSKRKRFVGLIDAFREAPGTLLNVGDAVLGERLSGDRAKLLGQLDREELREALWASNVFIHPAIHEAFGLVVAEAEAVR